MLGIEEVGGAGGFELVEGGLPCGGDGSGVVAAGDGVHGGAVGDQGHRAGEVELCGVEVVEGGENFYA